VTGEKAPGMRLWQALDPQTQQVLCTESGVLDFLKSFPPQWQQPMALIVPKALDAPVEDGTTPQEALDLFTFLTGRELAAVMPTGVTESTESNKPPLPS
jgi:hypothetical protein